MLISTPQASSLSIKLISISWLRRPPQSHLTLELVYGTQAQSLPLHIKNIESQQCLSSSDQPVEFCFDSDLSGFVLGIRLVLSDGTLFFHDEIDLILVEFYAEILTVVKSQETVFGWILLQLQQEDKASP